MSVVSVYKFRIIPLVTVIAVAVVSRVAAFADTGELDRYLSRAREVPVHIDMTCADAVFADRALAPVEGVWRISGSEGTFAVVADPETIFYKIILVDSPDRSLTPGTLIGAMTALGRKNSFDARIFTSEVGGLLSSPKRFTVSLADDGRLIIVPVTDRLKVNLWRLLPYMFRNSVKHVNDRPKNLDGALRIYPEPAVPPESSRYL